MNARVLDRIGKVEIISDRTWCAVVGITCFLFLTTLGAYVRIPLPFTPVPITLQTFFVLIGAAVLGRRLSVITQTVYFVFGWMGLPVFAAGYGAGAVLGPTGGYIVGFIAASWVIGKFLKRDENSDLMHVLLSLYLGMFVYFLLGSLWLMVFLGKSVETAFLLGVLPFIPGDVIKVIVAGIFYHSYQKRFRKIFPDA